MTAAHRRSETRRRMSPWLLLGLVTLTMLAIAALTLIAATSRPTAAATPSPLLVRTGVVYAVADDGTATIGNERITVAGLATPQPGQCGHDQAIDAERAVLVGQTVTLVPDPAMPAPGVAHVVTHDQASYTDRAIADGMGRPAPGPWTYAAVFTREADAARAAQAGLWPTCWTTP